MGNFGSEDRMDYTIIGGSVNLASRLESAADPDEVVVSEDTWLLVREVYRCEEKGSLTVKGINHPVKTYRVVGRVGEEAGRTEAEMDGFSLRYDPERLGREEGLRARKVLEALLPRLPRENG